MINITSVYNEDGTLYSPPKDEEYNNLLNQFPKCESGGYSYSCMFCNKCPYGNYFEWPEEYKEIVERHHNLIDQYLNEHNANGFNGLRFSFKRS